MECPVCGATYETWQLALHERRGWELEQERKRLEERQAADGKDK